MWTLAVLQVDATPAWVGPTVAISLAVIALSFLAIGVGAIVVALAAARQMKRLGTTVSGLQDDVRGTLQATKRIAEQGQDLMVLVRHEAGAYVETGRRLRRRVDRGADRVTEKLEDLEALYDIVHDEVEDTALDVAATLRSARRGNGMLGRVRRVLLPGR